MIEFRWLRISGEIICPEKLARPGGGQYKLQKREYVKGPSDGDYYDAREWIWTEWEDIPIVEKDA
jgi:hypothetical protein